MQAPPAAERPPFEARLAARGPAWIRALVGMPRLDRQEWDRLGPVSRWLVATRASALVMTLVAALVAGILAWRDGGADPRLFALAVVGLALAHATNNLVNDLVDVARGLDHDNYFRLRYGSHPLQHGLASRRWMLACTAGTGAAALAAGALLIAARGAPVAALLGAGAFFVLFYTWPLKTTGLGEPAVLLVWGPLMVGGAYLCATGRWSWAAVIASLPYALGPTAVLMGKHLDKIDADRALGVYTLPVRLGERASRAVVLALVALQYALVVALVASRRLGAPALCVTLALPAARWLVLAYRRPRPDAPPEGFPAAVWPAWYVAFAFHHTRRFGVWYLLGLLASLVPLRAIW